jgi:hypothetical protein
LAAFVEPQDWLTRQKQKKVQENKTKSISRKKQAQKTFMMYAGF